MLKLTVHSGRFQAEILCEALRTLDGHQSAEDGQGEPVAPGGAWTRALACGWTSLPRGSPPAHPRGLFCRSDPPGAAGSSCMRPGPVDPQGAEGDSPWGGADAGRTFLPSEPGVRREVL